MDDLANWSSDKIVDKLINQLFQPRVERRVLANGLTVVHFPDFSRELVSVQVWVKTGSIHEGDLIGSGVSHFLEHLLFKGTERRSGKEMSREIHAIGADMNAYTTFDRTVYYMDATSTVFPQVIDLLADSVLHSVLPAGEIDSERDVILREIDMDLDDPDSRLSQSLFRTAFRVHPYREPVIGHRNLFEQVKRDELLAYYKSRYVPNNMVVVVAGAVDWNDCLREVDACFGQVPRGRLAPALLPGEPTQLASRRESMRSDYGVTRGALGFKVPDLSDPDSPALDLLAYALGVGESSFLWERLRNQQRLLHYIDCRNWNPNDYGLFEISYICDHEKQSEIESAIFESFSEFCQSGLTEAVLQKVRFQLLKDEINRQKTISGQAFRLGFAEAVIGDIDHGYRYFQQLQTIGLQHLRLVAKRYLVKEHMTAVVLKPEKAIDPMRSPKAAPASDLESYESVQFSSGARLLMQNDARLPKVHIRCVMLGGPVYEPENQRGISELMAELLTKDTDNQTASEISTLVNRIGGSFTADGGNNTISLSLEVLPSTIHTAIDLLGDALTCPTFEEGTLRTELEAQIAGLKEEKDDIFDYGFRELRRHFFGKHPLSIASSGRIEDLESLNRSHLISHFKRLVTAPNIVVSVVGDFERDSLVAQLKPLMESKLRSAPFATDQSSRYNGPPEALELFQPLDREQAILLKAYPGVGICHQDSIKSSLLNELFNGVSSRLFERVREDKGLAYYVGTSQTFGLQTGMFTFYAGTHPEQVNEVAAEIDIEIARVKAGQVTEEELQCCRTRLRAARLMSQQTIGARALYSALNTSYGLPVETNAEYVEKLDQVSSESIAEFANTFFDNEKSVCLVVGS